MATNTAKSQFTAVIVPSASIAAVADSEFDPPTTDVASEEACAFQCLLDNHIGTSAADPLTPHYTYYPDPNDATEPQNIPSYRCAGFTYVGGKCTLYTSAALPELAPTAKAAASADDVTYYDLNCQNYGTRVSSIRGGARAHYCLCNQADAIDQANDVPGKNAVAMFEGERCTVPASWHHTNELHPSFNVYGIDASGANGGTSAPYFDVSAMSPAQQRWRTGFPVHHPSPGFNVHTATGIPYPIAAGDANTAAARVANAIGDGPAFSPVPPMGYSSPGSTSGQCTGQSLEGVLPTKSTCVPDSSGQTDHCQLNCAPPAAPPATFTATAFGAAAASSTPPTPPVPQPDGFSTGTTQGGANWCAGQQCDGSACPPGVAADLTAACNKSPASFDDAAKAYKQCIANGRAMVHQDGVDRADVSTWSQAQQNSLNQLLGSAGECSSYYTQADGQIAIIAIPEGAGEGGFHSQTAGQTNCEALFDASNALSEYSAINNCALTSITNCQAVNACSTQEIEAYIISTGKSAQIDISQADSININASANYTNSVKNNIANATQQSLSSIISQMNKQLADNESTANAGGGVADLSGGTVPQAGPRTFAQNAAAISSIVNNAISSQIENTQVTVATQEQKIEAYVQSSGDNAKITIGQNGLLDMQVSLITKNAVSNTVSTATTQALTTNIDQTNDDKRQLIGLILMCLAIVLLVAGAAVAGFFLVKVVGKMGKKAMTKMKSVAAQKVAQAPTQQQAAPAPQAQQPKAQQPKAQQPKAQQPKAQQPKAQQPKAPQPKAQQPKAQQPKAPQPKAQQPKAQQPKA